MDPFTHGLAGAAASASFSDKKKLRPAAFTGFVAAMLADVDIFIHDPADPLLNIELHRQFTHSLVFIPAGALVATMLIWWFVRRYLSLRETYCFSLAAYATSGIMDSFTSYGTKLLWPFSDERFAWNVISVFDPLFTTGILTAVIFALYKREKTMALIAWGWITLYLLFGYLQHERSRNAALRIADRRDHVIERMVVKPTLGNQILWSIRYQSNDSIYAVAIHNALFSEPTIYPGRSAPLIRWRSEYAAYEGTVLYKDIRRFSILSRQYLVRHPDHKNIIGDARYSMLPTSISPLWGVKVDTLLPDKHLPFLNFRRASPAVRDSFLKMLLGRE